MKAFLIVAVAVLFLVGCSKREEKSLGGVIAGERATVAQTSEFNAGDSVVIDGTMTEKCPVAGCWFVLRDQTGTIKVDLKNSEFVVVDVPLKSKMIVAGRVATNGTDRFIEATAARF